MFRIFMCIIFFKVFVIQLDACVNLIINSSKNNTISETFDCNTQKINFTYSKGENLLLECTTNVSSSSTFLEFDGKIERIERRVVKNITFSEAQNNTILECALRVLHNDSFTNQEIDFRPIQIIFHMKVEDSGNMRSNLILYSTEQSTSDLFPTDMFNMSSFNITVVEDSTIHLVGGFYTMLNIEPVVTHLVTPSNEISTLPTPLKIPVDSTLTKKLSVNLSVTPRPIPDSPYVSKTLTKEAVESKTIFSERTELTSELQTMPYETTTMSLSEVSTKIEQDQSLFNLSTSSNSVASTMTSIPTSIKTTKSNSLTESLTSFLDTTWSELTNRNLTLSSSPTTTIKYPDNTMPVIPTRNIISINLSPLLSAISSYTPMTSNKTENHLLLTDTTSFIDPSFDSNFSFSSNIPSNISLATTIQTTTTSPYLTMIPEELLNSTSSSLINNAVIIEDQSSTEAQTFLIIEILLSTISTTTEFPNTITSEKTDNQLTFTDITALTNSKLNASFNTSSTTPSNKTLTTTFTSYSHYQKKQTITLPEEKLNFTSFSTLNITTTTEKQSTKAKMLSSTNTSVPTTFNTYLVPTLPIFHPSMIPENDEFPITKVQIPLLSTKVATKHTTTSSNVTSTSTMSSIYTTIPEIVSNVTSITRLIQKNIMLSSSTESSFNILNDSSTITNLTNTDASTQATDSTDLASVKTDIKPVSGTPIILSPILSTILSTTTLPKPLTTDSIQPFITEMENSTKPMEDKRENHLPDIATLFIVFVLMFVTLSCSFFVIYRMVIQNTPKNISNKKHSNNNCPEIPPFSESTEDYVFSENRSDNTLSSTTSMQEFQEELYSKPVSKCQRVNRKDESVYANHNISVRLNKNSTFDDIPMETIYSNTSFEQQNTNNSDWIYSNQETNRMEPPKDVYAQIKPKRYRKQSTYANIRKHIE